MTKPPKSDRNPPTAGPQATSPSCQQIIDIFPDPFVVIDRDYRIVAANQNYLSHYGMQDTDQVVGQYCYKVSHHVDSPCSEHGEHCPLEQVFDSAQAIQVLHIHYDREGGEEHVELQSTPLFDSAGDVLYVGESIRPVHSSYENGTRLVGRSPAMLRMISLLQRVAPTQTSVLLLGESGVGKECVASYLHQPSARADRELVIVDCGTLGETLIESELFGHEKGAFTGATGRKKGLFEIAHQGTLFIDELAELPLPLQTKLLRVLESGTIRRIGGTHYIDVDVRIIAATNKNLQQMVERGEFRQDLYYRLSAFPIRIPPLRERLEDVTLLAEHFIGRFEEGGRHLPLSSVVVERLLDYDYPGNVRELRNILERANILAYEDALGPDHIVFEAARTVDSAREEARSEWLPDLDEAVDESPYSAHGLGAQLLSRRRGRLNEGDVMEALRRIQGHGAHAAEVLGVSERTLYRYIQRLKGDELGQE